MTLRKSGPIESGQRFFLTYVFREISRRRRQFVVISLGLAAGIALVVTVTAASAGVKRAQADVLHALFGIGTDVSVTKAPSTPPSGTHGLHAPSSGARGSGVAGPSLEFGAKPKPLNLLGVAPDLGVLDASAVRAILRLSGVAGAAGGLKLSDIAITIPSRAQVQSGHIPPSATGSSSTVDGVDVTRLGLGPLASGTVIRGRPLAAAEATANVAVVDSGYALANGLKVGSTITISDQRFKVIGIIRQPQGGGAADVYIPLERAQALARYRGVSLAGKVDVIYVRARSASAISRIQREISRLMPSATVTSSGTLARAVSGSLASAASLANDLGRWLAISTLITAFGVSGLLTLSAVGRRVREIGTLKALGWRSRRVVAQILGELAVVAGFGAIVGIALGFGGAALVTAAAPRLSATVAQSPGSTPPQDVSLNAAGIQRHVAPGAVHTVAVHLTASVTVGAIALAVLLALAGVLVSGALGGWRAGRLRPAEALRSVA
jgi:putative ABC transport system permease protein